MVSNGSMTKVKTWAIALTGMAIAVAIAMLVITSWHKPSAPSASDRPPTESFKNEAVVAFYGDSFTRGVGATNDDTRWSTVLSQDRGWEEFNPSVSGLGFVTNREAANSDDILSQIIAVKPDVVVVALGLNDNFNFDKEAEKIREQIAADLERLHSSLPGTRVVVVEPFWHLDDRPASVEKIIGWVKQSTVETDAYYIGGASHWLENRPDWLSRDGMHPNDAGHAEIAKRMSEELASLGL
jgi:lysophospholipase L1-like esterase